MKKVLLLNLQNNNPKGQVGIGGSLLLSPTGAPNAFLLCLPVVWRLYCFVSCLNFAANCLGSTLAYLFLILHSSYLASSFLIPRPFFLKARPRSFLLISFSSFLILVPHPSFLAPHSSILLLRSLQLLVPHALVLVSHSSFLISNSSFLISRSLFLISHSPFPAPPSILLLRSLFLISLSSFQVPDASFLLP